MRFPISVRPPSATCANEMPSFALRSAWPIDRICAFKFSLMERPAASSPALVMRSPDDKRW